MDKYPRPIDVLLFPGVNLLDIAGPVQAFKEATLHGKPAYHLRFVTLPAAMQSSNDATTEKYSKALITTGNTDYDIQTSCGMRVRADHCATASSVNTDLLVPGGEGVDALIGNHHLRKLIAEKCAAKGNARLISICSGALLLADAQILNNRRATTHWAREAQVHKQFPDVLWNMNQIIVHDEQIHTSAGVTTGIDLALSIIKQDCGSSVALAVARELVVSLKRSGGQNQFAQVIEWQFSAEDSIAELVSAIIEQPAHHWTLDLMASRVSTTTRTLSRKFSHHFNTSPMKFVEQIRIRVAGDMLSTGMPVQKVAERSGFRDVQALRRACKRQLNTTLGDYIRKFSDVEHDHLPH